MKQEAVAEKPHYTTPKDGSSIFLLAIFVLSDKKIFCGNVIISLSFDKYYVLLSHSRLVFDSFFTLNPCSKAKLGILKFEVPLRYHFYTEWNFTTSGQQDYLSFRFLGI